MAEQQPQNKRVNPEEKNQRERGFLSALGKHNGRRGYARKSGADQLTDRKHHQAKQKANKRPRFATERFSARAKQTKKETNERKNKRTNNQTRETARQPPRGKHRSEAQKRNGQTKRYCFDYAGKESGHNQAEQKEPIRPNKGEAGINRPNKRETRENGPTNATKCFLARVDNHGKPHERNKLAAECRQTTASNKHKKHLVSRQ